MKKSFIILILIFTCMYPSLLLPQGNWKLVKSRSGIKVYNRSARGTNISEFKGITIIKSSANKLLSILKDIPSHTRWRRNCIISYMVKKHDDSNMIIYNVTKAPWPLDYRDSIVQITIISTREKNKIIITMTALKENLVPLHNSYVRITELTGQFILETISPAHTRVIYTIKANPAGVIPASIANIASRNIPYYTLRGLRRMVYKKRKK